MLKKHINAVKKTIEMWEWLIDNPTKHKLGYLIQSRYRKWHQTECFLCGEWNNGIIDCEDDDTVCPLDNDIGKQCDHDSPFAGWCFVDQKAAKIRNAQIIVDLCKDWLKKYEE